MNDADRDVKRLEWLVETSAKAGERPLMKRWRVSYDVCSLF